LAECRTGTAVVVLGPLGRPFPNPATAEQPIRHVLLAGGVGLPPLLAWRRAWGRDGDLCFFGGRDGGDVPWRLLGDEWRCSVDRHVDVPGGSEAFTGNVVDLARAALGGTDDGQRRVLTCGPLPLLRAAVAFARERSWDCYVSVEERMGCGYGVCRGCVVPRAGGAGYLTACHDGPVLAAETIDWDRIGHGARGAPPASNAGCTCKGRDA
jgi:dihydroorotate dehydrogenase electron transfer subunit